MVVGETGLWLSVGTPNNTLIMDVEGTDGRERGENQVFCFSFFFFFSFFFLFFFCPFCFSLTHSHSISPFAIAKKFFDNQEMERKSAVFSLAISQVLIINMFEHDVGRYNGANYGLLKTVFDVNLQLFQAQGSPKTLLLFVIRDHAQTPLENLADTLRADLNKIWGDLSKPKGLENSSIDNFFDFKFAALPHKIFQLDKFVAGVNNLRTWYLVFFDCFCGVLFFFSFSFFSFYVACFLRKRNRFSDPSNPDYLFQPQYHKQIPADGFYKFVSNIWVCLLFSLLLVFLLGCLIFLSLSFFFQEKIIHNKDLDLPTQRELLAQFRCNEISSVSQEFSLFSFLFLFFFSFFSSGSPTFYCRPLWKRSSRPRKS